MTVQSLNDIMNQMAEGDALLSFCAVDDQEEYHQEMAEFDAFLRLDDRLQELNKEYLDAKSQHDELIDTFGCDDAMAEVAADVMDSAWCAVQTRYLEIRAKSELMKKAQLMMLEATRAINEAREKKELQKSIERGERLIMTTRIISQMRELNSDKIDYLLAAVVILFGLLRFNNTFFHFKSVFNQHRYSAAV